MTAPPKLNTGDRVAIVSPAGKVKRENILISVRVLVKWGLKPVLGHSVFGSSYNFAGTDEERLADLQQMLDDPGVRAIFCARGGYGSVRVIDTLDFSGFLNHPKWIIGFSDITVFHSHIHSNFGIRTIHGPMPNSMYREEDGHIACLRRILFGESLPSICGASDSRLNRTGHCSGILTGGNLAVLCSLLGSNSDIMTKEKILFLEDVGEHLYRIDRMVLALKRAGKLAGLAGMVVGGFTEIQDTEEEFGRSAYGIIKDAVSEYGYPVAYGFPAGHIDGNMPLVFGQEAMLKVTKDRGELKYTVNRQ